MDRHYSERVPMLPNMNHAEFSRSESERSVSPAISVENLPIRKRYTRSHEYLSDSASQNFASQNFSSQNFTSQNFSSQNFSTPSNGYSSNEESSSYAGYSSADESDKEVALDYTKPRNVVRAGVIRHSSNPSSCLAYYYLHKYQIQKIIKILNLFVILVNLESFRNKQIEKIFFQNKIGKSEYKSCVEKLC